MSPKSSKVHTRSRLGSQELTSELTLAYWSLTDIIRITGALKGSLELTEKDSLA